MCIRDRLGEDNLVPEILSGGFAQPVSQDEPDLLLPEEFDPIDNLLPDLLGSPMDLAELVRHQSTSSQQAASNMLEPIRRPVSPSGRTVGFAQQKQDLRDRLQKIVQAEIVPPHQVAPIPQESDQAASQSLSPQSQAHLDETNSRPDEPAPPHETQNATPQTGAVQVSGHHLEPEHLGMQPLETTPRDATPPEDHHDCAKVPTTIQPTASSPRSFFSLDTLGKVCLGVAIAAVVSRLMQPDAAERTLV
eukprot:TRINITY_DN17919_c0_g1_i2.p1 TRINITY_DN17919_c0_g1~~TRINITY_DN17919_c0_g1_i2.p1  ORF type:complete len:248 (+),score=26.30 TRINITY_DN17919_c0_g1_i2:121-864(+)